MPRRRPLLVVAVMVILALVATVAFVVDRPVLMHRMLAARAGEYLVPAHLEGFALDTHAPGVHSFRDGFDRGLLVETTEGLVVVDPFSAKTATRLKAALDARFPGRPVRALVYSHAHLDHVRGGAVLAPQEVVAHERCTLAWRDFPADDILAPTRTLAGDATLTFGGVELRLVFHGRSHGDTLYSVHLPASRVVFAPDLAFVRALPPGGMPDYFTPGFLAALDRVEALDFDVLIPSHFDVGTKADFSAFRAFFRFVNTLATDEVARRGWPESAADGEALFRAVYEPVRERYRDWHGFDEMVMPLLIRQITGAALGY
jgi:glyoxylase-like metal-dependent hydrolase (beta-lactamase superfamily II)